jgi:hypothetical protein
MSHLYFVMPSYRAEESLYDACESARVARCAKIEGHGPSYTRARFYRFLVKGRETGPPASPMAAFS